MEIVVIQLPPQLQRALNLVTTLVAMCAIGIMAWYAGQEAWHSLERREMSFAAISFPVYPARLVIALGLFLLALQLFVGHGPAGCRGVARVSWGQVAMTPVEAGGLIIGLLMVLLAMGMPIAFALLTSGVVGVYLTRGPAGFSYVLATFPSHISNFAYVVVPLFLLMSHPGAHVLESAELPRHRDPLRCDAVNDTDQRGGRGPRAG